MHKDRSYINDTIKSYKAVGLPITPTRYTNVNAIIIMSHRLISMKFIRKTNFKIIETNEHINTNYETRNVITKPYIPVAYKI